MIGNHQLLLHASVLGLALSVAGCQSSDCVVPITDDDDDPNDSYVDPFAGWQDVHLDQEILEVGGLAFGASEAVEVVLSNEGDLDLIIESVELANWSSSNWTLTDSEAPEELEPGEDFVVELVFTNSSPQDSYAALDVYTNDPDEERASVGLVGRAESQRADARLTPVILDFGFVFTGQTGQGSLELSNQGDAPLEILGLELDQPDVFFELLTDEATLVGSSIEAGDSQSIDVLFQPSSLLERSAQLTLETNDPERPQITSQLRGNGDGAQGCTPPSIELLSPTEPTAWQLGFGQHMEISATVDDAEQPASLLLVELFIGDQIIEDEFSSTGGAVEFDIDLDEYEVDEVFESFPEGLHTFTLRVTDGCPLSSSVQFVGLVDTVGLLDPSDADGDGWSSADGDCDDAESATFPGAHELLDGLDNDCDLIVDEATAAWDDDCDGYCESPPCLGQGPEANPSDSCSGLADDSTDLADCSDLVADIDSDGSSDGRLFSPGLEETSDLLDNDCDGTTDEGTSYSDDDGDGLNEASGDCDDDEPTVFPGATEWCDELDNDCTGGADDDCIELSLAPRIVGDIRTNRFQIPLGTQVEAQVVTLSDDPSLSYTWATDKGSFVGSTDGPEVTWTAPAATDDNAALFDTFANLQVTVTDSAGRDVNGFGVLLLSESDGTQAFSAVGQGTCGCSMVPDPTHSPGSWSLLLLLALGTLKGLRAQRG